MVAKRIPHKTQCDHAQTPYARRKCRAAKLAAAQEATMQQPTYNAGDEIDINGTVIILGRRKGNSGIRWNWIAPEIEAAGVIYLPTPEEAIAHARRTLADRCACGNIAEVNGSTRRTCVACH